MRLRNLLAARSRWRHGQRRHGRRPLCVMLLSASDCWQPSGSVAFTWDHIKISLAHNYGVKFLLTLLFFLLRVYYERQRIHVYCRAPGWFIFLGKKMTISNIYRQQQKNKGEEGNVPDFSFACRVRKRGYTHILTQCSSSPAYGSGSHCCPN
jgi:hypothetical protein